jgi:O-antigen ligase
MSITCFILGGVILLWYQKGFQLKYTLSLRIAIPCCLIAVIISLMLSLSFKLPLTIDAFKAFNRYQNMDTVMSLAGRTEIWHYAIKRMFDGPYYSLLFGHGYCVSRFVLNEGGGGPSFFVSHGHNIFIESLVSVGLLGTSLLIVLVIYSVTWLTRFSQLRREFSSDFALRAISVVSMVLINCFLESRLSSKVNPVTFIYLFYLFALDRRRYLS